MKIQKSNIQYKQSFGNKHKLTNETIKHIENKTKLTYKEMQTLSLEEMKNLMRKRKTLREPNKIKQWFSNKYKQIGEKLGFLQKEYNIYSHVD